MSEEQRSKSIFLFAIIIPRRQAAACVRCLPLGGDCNFGEGLNINHSIRSAMDSEKEVSENEAIRLFQQMKREAQMMIGKISELEYELGEHDLVQTNVASLDPNRTGFRLVGTVLIRQTVGEILPKVRENRDNIAKTIDQLREALANKNVEAANWKEKYKIKTQQEYEVETRTRELQKAAEAKEAATAPSSGGGVLA